MLYDISEYLWWIVYRFTYIGTNLKQHKEKDHEKSREQDYSIRHE